MPQAPLVPSLTAVRRSASDGKERSCLSARGPISWRRAAVLAAGLTATVLVALSYIGPPLRSRTEDFPSTALRLQATSDAAVLANEAQGFPRGGAAVRGGAAYLETEGVNDPSEAASTGLGEGGAGESAGAAQSPVAAAVAAAVATASPQDAEPVAICSVAREGGRDVREWVEHHRALGVSKFYVMDVAARVPFARDVADYIASGLIDYFYSSNLGETTDDPVLYVFDTCLAKFGQFHRWVAFLGVDDFLVLAQSAQGLPAFLDENFADAAGLVVNLRTFGPGGHFVRPQGSVRRNYVRCLPPDDMRNAAVRTLAHTARGGIEGALSARHFQAVAGAVIVNEHGQRVEGPITPSVSTERIAVHHYATKSWEDFNSTLGAPPPPGEEPRTPQLFASLNASATHTCTQAASIER